MGFTTCTVNTGLIAALATLPNATDGLSAAQLKAKFDKAATDLKTYINSFLTELESVAASDYIGSDIITGVSGATIYDQLTDLKNQIDGVALGDLPDASVTAAKMAADMTKDVSGGIHGYNAATCLFKKGTGTFTDNDTAQTFTDAFCTTSSFVIVTVTSGTPAGLWSVAEGTGDFTITSTAAESADIGFTYIILKAVA